MYGLLYRYRNKYSGEDFIFDSVRLLRYSVSDPRIRKGSYCDMKKEGVITPYNISGYLADLNDLLIYLEPNCIAVWYKGYRYDIVYDEALYINDELVCGAYQIINNRIALEYLYLEDDSVQLGIGSKQGGMSIGKHGYVLYYGELYPGIKESKLDFRSRYS